MLRVSLVMSMCIGSYLLAQVPQTRANRWEFLGSTAVARTGACAVQMTDGRLLLAGGGPPGASRKVDILDAGGAFTAGAEMGAGHARHACALLPDGKILVTGGFDGQQVMNESYLYDPAANAWMSGGSMAAARMGHTATRLADGRVLIAGGENGGGVLNTMEIYDPATGSFTAAGAMAMARKDHAAALLPDGRVLLAGGASGSGALASVESFDAGAGMSRMEGQLTAARAGLSATTLADGTVLLAGGNNGLTALASAEIFEMATGVSTETAAMTAGRTGHFAFLSAVNGEVLLVGGDGGAGTAELFRSGTVTATSGGRTAAGQASGRQATATAASGGVTVRMAPGTGSGTLDQCANGPFNGGFGTTCTEWVNGNLNASKASYREGDSVPYRLRMSGIPTGVSNTVTIEWDTTQSGKHALDYLTRFNASVTGANPCMNGACSGTPTTFPTPLDPNITAGDSQPSQMLPGRYEFYAAQNALQYFTMWGGTITAVSTPLRSGLYTGSSATSVTITFTASIANPVLSWGGHIATRVDWGATHSAVAINGSPFHMRLKEVNGSGGNQDRALSNDAAQFPAVITITKNTKGITPPANAFTFTASPGIPDGYPTPTPVTTFALPVDNAGTLVYSRVFQDIYVQSGTQTYTVTESALAGNWSFESVSCQVIAGTGTATPNQASRSATFVVREGDVLACTFTNAAPVSVSVTKACVPTGDLGKFILKIGGAESSEVGCGGGPFVQEVAIGANITVSEIAGTGTSLANYDTVVNCGTAGSTSGTSHSFTMPTANVSCTVTNTRKANTVTLQKVCVPGEDGGTFVLGINGSTATTDCSGSHSLAVTGGTTVTLSEAAGTGTSLDSYTTEFSCPAGVILSGTGYQRTFTMPDGPVTCTVTNTRKANTVTLQKACVPSGDLGKFVLGINGNTSADKSCGGSHSLAVTGGTTVTLSEAAGTGTSLDNYTTEFSCPAGVILSGTGYQRTFTMPDQSVTCTVTNTRKSYPVTLTKACMPGDDGGLFVLGINGNTAEKGCGLSHTLNVTGGTTVTLSEAAGTGTNLTDYATSFACVDTSSPPNTVALTGTGYTRTFGMPDRAVNCTVTNVKPSITINKTCSVGLAAMNATLAVTVASSGQVCNTGTVPLTILSVTDAQINAVGGANATAVVTFDKSTALAAGACRNFTSTFTPAAPSTGTTCATGDATCTAAFQDKITVTAQAEGVTTNLVKEAEATCSLCRLP
jgi:hypothetical protein